MAGATEQRVLIDPYLDWAAAEGVPVIEDYGVDLLAAEVRPWPRFGMDGAIIHLKARGDFVTLYVQELRPGSATPPIRHLYEQLVYVLAGNGSTEIDLPGGRKLTFEWGPHSLFALPLNMRYRLFNGSGAKPARLACCNTFPLSLNYLMNEQVIFDCPADFPERLLSPKSFEG